MQKELCAFCAMRPASTRDHIPPKTIFCQPRTNDLITVPACLACNKGSSKIEEIFRVYLTLRIGVRTDLTADLWQKSLRTLRRRHALRRSILGATVKIPVTTDAGIFLGERPVFHWPPRYHDPVIEKIARGLYFHRFGRALGASVTVKAYWCKTEVNLYDYSQTLDHDVRQLWKELPTQAHSGAGVFRYSVGCAAENPFYSVWLFDFYGAHFAGAYTSPVDA